MKKKFNMDNSGQLTSTLLCAPVACAYLSVEGLGRHLGSGTESSRLHTASAPEISIDQSEFSSQNSLVIKKKQ